MTHIDTCTHAITYGHKNAGKMYRKEGSVLSRVNSRTPLLCRERHVYCVVNFPVSSRYSESKNDFRREMLRRASQCCLETLSQVTNNATFYRHSLLYKASILISRWYLTDSSFNSPMNGCLRCLTKTTASSHSVFA